LAVVALGQNGVSGLGAQPFGLGLASRTRSPSPRPGAGEPTPKRLGSLERAVVQGVGDREVLVATKDGRIVVAAPPGTGVSRPTGRRALDDLMRAELARLPRGGPWRRPCSNPANPPSTRRGRPAVVRARARRSLPGAGNTSAATLLAEYPAGESARADTGAMGRKTNASLVGH
jgi:hypothetical protein